MGAREQMLVVIGWDLINFGEEETYILAQTNYLSSIIGCKGNARGLLWQQCTGYMRIISLSVISASLYTEFINCLSFHLVSLVSQMKGTRRMLLAP